MNRRIKPSTPWRPGILAPHVGDASGIAWSAERLAEIMEEASAGKHPGMSLDYLMQLNAMHVAISDTDYIIYTLLSGGFAQWQQQTGEK